LPKPDDAQEQLLDQWAERIHRSGLTVVAVPLLEIGRGLGFLASQALLLAKPLLASLVDDASIDRYVTLLDDPDALEKLIERVERKAEGDG
jgi:hypothetical protein